MPAHLRSRRKPALPFPLLSRSLVIFVAAVLVVMLTFSSTSSPHVVKLQSLPEELPPYQCPSTRRRPIYIFQHLHKTGGNNLKRALFAFASRNNLTLYHTCHPPIPDSALMAWWLNRQKSFTSLDCNLDLLSKLPRRNLSAIHFIVGHQHHGAHALFPKFSPRYFTFLRHPLLRKTSHFLHFESKNESLVGYLLARNRNYMTKRLATRSPASQFTLDLRERIIDADSFASRGALSAARTHLLRNFFFVGLHHRYAESVCILAHILNRACRCGRTGSGNSVHSADRLASAFPLRYRRVAAARANVGGRTKVAVAALPYHIREKVLFTEAEDLYLFRLAEKLFEQKLQQYEQCRDTAALSQYNV